MFNVESRFVIGPSNTLSAGMYAYTFLRGNLTGCGSEGVKRELWDSHSDLTSAAYPAIRTNLLLPDWRGVGTSSRSHLASSLP